MAAEEAALCSSTRLLRRWSGRAWALGAAMSRLSRVGSETPVLFPPIVATDVVEEKRLTPSPPQKAKHPKKHQHANDYRIHLEPLRPPTSGGGAASPNALFSSSSTELLGEPKLVDGSGTGRSDSGNSVQRELERSMRFFKQLASIKLRQVTSSEETLLKTIDALLQSTSLMLGADLIVLYSFDDQARVLNVTSSTKPSAAGFQVSLDRYCLEPLLVLEADGENPVQSDPVFVPNVQDLEAYDEANDVDSKVGTRTCSLLASVIFDEQDKPIFIVEARSARDVAFSTSLFSTAMTTLENIVGQFDLKQMLMRSQENYRVLDDCLGEAVLPQTWTPLSPQQSTESLPEPEQPGPSLHDFEDEEEDEARALRSPDLQHMIWKIQALARVDAVCLLHFHPIKKTCCVTAAAAITSDDGGNRDTVPVLLNANLLATIGNAAPDDLSDQGLAPLYYRLYESVDNSQALDLSHDPELAGLVLDPSWRTKVFLPLPRTVTTSSSGLLCFARQPNQSVDVQSLHPVLATLGISIVIKKKNEDMRTSTLQKRKLIKLFNSHFQVENINDPSALVNMICSIGSDIFHTKRVTLYVADPIKCELWSLSTLGSATGLRIPYGTGIAGTVAFTKQTMFVRNPYQDPRFDPSFDIKFGFKTEALFTLPVLDKNGEVLGVIQAVNPQHFLVSTDALIAKFDERVLDVYNHLVAHALRINSSLIMFAKVQADYWANRVVMDIHSEEEVAAKCEVASVHSLLDISGFDDAKRVPRNKWSTFAYACWALGRFLALVDRVRARLRAERADSFQEDPVSSRGNRFDLDKAVEDMQLRTKRSPSQMVRFGRTSSLLHRWRRMTERGSSIQDELLSDNFDPLTKTIAELKNYSVVLFESLNLASTFRIEDVTLRRFIDTLAGRYQNVPYHSFYHGFDVAHSSFKLIRQTSVIGIIKEFEALSLIIAALGHDADHPGNDNQFEVDSGSALALCYNDISVLESHHAATTFRVIKMEGCDVLKDLSAVARAGIRSAIVRCILATDMKHHTKLLSELSAVARVEDFETVTDGRQLMLNMIIHGSDLGSVARPLNITLKWVDRVCEEFTQQAKRSEELGIFVPPHIVNLEDEVVKSRLQVNFIDYLVAPLWNLIATILPEARPSLDCLRANRDYFFEHAGQMSARRASSNHQAAATHGSSSAVRRQPSAHTTGETPGHKSTETGDSSVVDSKGGESTE
ncbi:TPA: hypothetical protein N0F65_012884 [Lagenidium giganteum]|uniref:PDEase domain-containing protein n=1 Tax=Lagenidium giganteum TaxID=4803 RepID=A0AAV2YKU3_9STRA|nr:TPA: hypothetical protein N0F65_012884 [Lagenidium giganteum]